MPNKSLVLAGILLASLAIPFTSYSHAQSDSSSLSGAVTDNTGALVIHAKVTVRNTATGREQVVMTNESGNFTLPDVASGSYTVQVESTGFQTVSLNDVRVDPSIGRRVDITLQIGESSSTVTVEAGANSVQTESAAVGQLVAQEQVKSIQLNGRNPLYLSQMEPGVVRNASMAAFAFGLDNGINVSGARSQESVITLDGAPMVRTRSNGTSVGVADVDSTSQIQILTTNYQAEYGRASGGQVRMVPKSGTSQFHGAVYEYFRNTALNANTWIRNSSTNPLLRNKPPGFRYNQFGWNFNGPVVFPGFNTARQKLFFLAGQEWVRYNHDETVTQTAPTALMRTGNFSELLSPNIFYAGSTQVYDPNTGLPVPGNIITTGLSANGLALLNAFPLPNATAPNYNWIDSALYSERQRKDTLVLDYVPAEAHRIRFTLLNYNYDDLEPHYGNFNRNPRIFHRPNQVAVVHYAWNINPTTVNELVVSAAADHVFINIDTSSGRYDRTKYGINYPYLYSATTKTIPNKIPTISISNFQVLDGGPYPSHSGGIVYDLGDNLTKVIGNHTLKMGFNFERAGENNFDQIGVSSTVPGATNNQNGFFRFTDSRTNNPQTSKVAVANAAYGLFDTYGEIGQRSYTLFRGNMYEGFAQDQWRAKSNLVIEMGVRYSIMQPYSALWGNQSVFSPKDYNPANAVTVDPKTDAVTGGDPLNGVVIPGSSFPSSAAGHVSTDLLTNYNRLFHGYSPGYSAVVYSNVQPRVGFAWQLHPDTVLRGGAGRYFQRLGISDQVFLGGNAPFQPASTVTNGQVNNPGGVGTNSFPTLFSSQPYTYPSPEAYGWNLTLEHEFRNVGTFNMAYVGRRGIHLEQLRNLNQLQPGTTLLPANIGVQPDSLRPYKGFSNITEEDNQGSSIYHSLQTNLRRRLNKNILFGAAYTWSKSMDFGSGNGSTLPNAYDRFSNYGPSDFDTRHVLVVNYVWNITYADKVSNFATRSLLSNWQLSGTMQAQTGRPFSVSQSNDYAGVGPGSGAQYWRLTRHPNLYKGFAGSNASGPKWFESSAFASPIPGTFAPRSTRNQLTGPGFQSYNAALQKTIHIIPGHDNHSVVFKAEAFNLANHPNIDTPTTNPTSGTFGLSTTKGGTYASDRQFQFSLRYVF